MLRRNSFFLVTPAQAGVHLSTIAKASQWLPAFAGMTEIEIFVQKAAIEDFCRASYRVFVLDSRTGVRNAHGLGVTQKCRTHKDCDKNVTLFLKMLPICTIALTGDRGGE